jgi:hypothetical protein
MRAVTLFLAATCLFADDQNPPVGSTWKLRSEKILEGNAPSVPIGKMWTIRPLVVNPPKERTQPWVPADVAKFSVSPDGRVLTNEAQGTDAKGKMYRYILTWDRQ